MTKFACRTLPIVAPLNTTIPVTLHDTRHVFKVVPTEPTCSEASSVSSTLLALLCRQGKLICMCCLTCKPFGFVFKVALPLKAFPESRFFYKAPLIASPLLKPYFF